MRVGRHGGRLRDLKLAGGPESGRFGLELGHDPAVKNQWAGRRFVEGVNRRPVGV